MLCATPHYFHLFIILFALPVALLIHLIDLNVLSYILQLSAICGHPNSWANKTTVKLSNTHRNGIDVYGVLLHQPTPIFGTDKESLAWHELAVPLLSGLMNPTESNKIRVVLTPFSPGRKSLFSLPTLATM